MIHLPPRKSLAELVEALQGQGVKLWCSPRAAELMRHAYAWTPHESMPALEAGDWLVAAGGGKLIDRAKLLKAETPGARLVALPTIWGSGAEASPIAVWTEGDAKRFRMGPELLPDVIVYEAQFCKSLPFTLVRHACGDAWAHALEGFLSPLASEGTRQDLAAVMTRMLQLGIQNDPAWFELSALACAGQAASSVGLVHGIAHVVEGHSGFGHARICATCLLPVMLFNRNKSPKWPLLAQYGLPEAEIIDVLEELFETDAYARLRPILASHWKTVLRDPCTRTNSALLRPDDLGFFEHFQT